MFQTISQCLNTGFTMFYLYKYIQLLNVFEVYSSPAIGFTENMQGNPFSLGGKDM